MTVVLTQEALPGYPFAKSEALLLCDRAHAEFIARHGNHTVHDATVIALTADAHGTALRTGIHRVVPPYDLAGYGEFFAECYQFCVSAAKDWLHELGLAVVVEGINLAEFDALYQYWFFQYAAYIDGIARTLFAAYPDIERFFVPLGETFLPAEFYFDTDIAAGVIRHVGESLGRTVVPIVMRDRPLHFAAWSDRRPFMEPAPATSRYRGAAEGEPRHRIGIVPATLHRYERFAAALRSMSADVTVFSSAWARDRAASSEAVRSPPQAWLETLRQTLETYWQAFLLRREGSSLPDYVVRNPYINDQFSHIIRERWFDYSRYIHMAAHFATENPLDLLIYSDHFTPEGTIFSHLYRKFGTRVVVTPHSPHFFAAPYAAWKLSDIAIVSTGFAEMTARHCGLSEIHHVGYNNPVDPLPPAETGARRRVLLLANALEVQFPLMDIKAFLEAVAVLAAPPEPLSDKVEVAARLKPGIFSEDPLIFETLCGLPAASTLEQTAMPLRDCIGAADCVVGIGLSSSAYLEVIGYGKPLVHVALADIHPMCPPDFIPGEIGRVVGKDGIWPEIEAVLFDADHRARLLAVQKAYLDEDRRGSFAGGGDSLAQALSAILSRRPMEGRDDEL